MRHVIVAAALLATTACQTAPASSNALRVQVQSARSASAAPALGAVVVRCSRDLDFAQDGVSRIDTQTPLAPDARFDIGSNAKSMLATLAATFVRDGALRWDTRVEDVFAAEAATLDPAMRQVTLAQLLSHRSGVASYSSGQELSTVRLSGGTASAQRLNFALQVLREAPQHPPGTFLYSNAGYVIAGAMLERIGGKPFEDLMRERLFAPLHMNGARFGASLPTDTGQPLGHFSRDGTQNVYLDSDPAIPPFLQPAGDVSLSLEDYGHYLREHLCGLRGERTQTLPADMIHFMHQPQGEDGASLGWGRYAFDEVPASIHVGGTGTFNAFVAILPSRDLAVATVTNSGADESRQAALTLMRALVAEHLAP